MSSVCLKIMTILCLSGTAVSDPGSSGVVLKEIGRDVTIQCRNPQKDQESLALKKGLNMEYDVFFNRHDSEKVTIAMDFRDRLQYNGLFPNIDILIKNVTSKDTDTYWCVYNKFGTPVTKNGKGSILLVVTEPRTDSLVPRPPCDQSNNNNNYLILVLVVIGAAVLLGIIICFLVWIITKTKSLRSAKKPRRVATNDVYEEMRGTIRR
ncbi:uncharacterized protein [Notothenia coriiceps]|uniref:Immunoglobulin V-set domain-containing protein n=1 Tax=Notothenia coriiceps TaxID=8208 RepID=A0A6I9N6Y8_9TELE|nr:PREDICTED: uncharacterized protein LOC104946063 [Notothenia coriiceps]